MKLQIENVSLSIDGSSILEHLNLNVHEHEILVLGVEIVASEHDEHD